MCGLVVVGLFPDCEQYNTLNDIEGCDCGVEDRGLMPMSECQTPMMNALGLLGRVRQVDVRARFQPSSKEACRNA
jgi:hypothetical protein